MKKAGKIVSLILSGMMAVSILGGCGGSTATDKEKTAAVSTAAASTAAPEPTKAEEKAKVYEKNGLPSDQQVTLKVGFFEAGNGREWYDYCVSTFTKEFPNVKFDTVYSPKISDLVQTKAAAGNDDEMFDLFSTDWADLAKNGKLEPMDELWDREVYDTAGKKLRDVLIPGTVEGTQKMNGKLYNMPQNAFVGGLFFDKKFFEQNGWNQNPKTWDEFVKLCEDIKAKKISPIIYPGIYPDYIDLTFAVKPFEVAEINGNTEFVNNYRNWKMPQFSNPEMLEKWKRLNEMGKKGYFDPNLTALNHTQSQMKVLQHKAAMVSSGDWIANEMKDSIPEGFEWGYMSVPFGSDPNNTIYIQSGGGGGMQIWAGKPDLNKKWSKEFLLWLFNKDSQKAIAEKGGALPFRADLDMKDSTLTGSQKAVNAYMANNKTKTESLVRETKVRGENINKALKIINEAYNPMVLGKKDPEAVLKQVDELFMKDLGSK